MTCFLESDAMGLSATHSISGFRRWNSSPCYVWTWLPRTFAFGPWMPTPLFMRFCPPFAHSRHHKNLNFHRIFTRC